MLRHAPIYVEIALDINRYTVLQLPDRLGSTTITQPSPIRDGDHKDDFIGPGCIRDRDRNGVEMGERPGLALVAERHVEARTCRGHFDVRADHCPVGDIRSAGGTKTFGSTELGTEDRVLIPGWKLGGRKWRTSVHGRV